MCMYVPIINTNTSILKYFDKRTSTYVRVRGTITRIILTLHAWHPPRKKETYRKRPASQYTEYHMVQHFEL